MILAIDPGKDKCGIVMMDEAGKVFFRKVVPRPALAGSILELIASNAVACIVLGSGHFGKEVQEELKKRGISTKFAFVSEKDSTWQARKQYWRENQPKGWKRLIPTSFLSPPVPIDDYAAEIIGCRWLKLL